MTTAQEVYDSVRQRLGIMARRREQGVPTPNQADQSSLLERYLADGLSELGTRTDRLTQNVVLQTTANQGYVDRPPHIYTLDEAAIHHSGSAFPLTVKDGQELAKLARQPNPTTERPTEIGAYAGKFWFWGVPDDQYDVDMQVQLNGEFTASGAPAADEPPLLDTYVEVVPTELERALVAYVIYEWLKDNGNAEMAETALGWFESRLAKHQNEPVHQSSATREYNPLSL